MTNLSFSSLFRSKLVSDNSIYGQFVVLLQSPMFWIAVTTTTLATLLPDIIWFVKCKIAYFKLINSVINEKI